MTRKKSDRQALTIGQLATRWGVGVDRVRELVRTGQIRGAFVIPSAGRFGETTKIPIDSIEDVERHWAVVEVTFNPNAPVKYRSRVDPKTDFRHFPELCLETNPDGQSIDGVDQYRQGDSAEPHPKKQE